MAGKLSINDLKAYSLKALFRPLDMIGDRFFFNRDPPHVKEVVADVHYGSQRNQRLDIIRPEGEPPWPILIYFHGGGWVVGSKASYSRICRTLARNGYLTVNVDYRLAPRFKCQSQMQDIARAIRWVYTHADAYGGDASQIVLGGDSAGALHASWYASALHDPRLQATVGIDALIPSHALDALVLFYGVYDLDSVLKTSFPFMSVYTQSFLGTEPWAYERWAEMLSPLRHVSAGLPPVFLCAGEEDGLFPQSAEYAQALERAGIPHRALFLSKSQYPDSGHGFLYFYDRQCSRVAMYEAGRFLKEISGGG